ncbi:MAG: glycosyltransferase [Microcella sp.]
MTYSLRTTLGRTVEALPERLSLALRPAAYRYSLSEKPAPVPALDGEVRLLIGHANYAAQGYWFARAAERLDGVSAVNLHLLGPNEKYGFPADHIVPRDVFQHSAHWRREHFKRVVDHYTHVIIESGIPMFGKLFGHDTFAEIEALRDRGVKVAMIAHGSELRLPSRHVQIDEWSPYAGDRWPDTALLERRARSFRHLLERSRVPLFVTTQELLLDWPEATWIPLSIDLNRWAGALPVLQRERPVVVHAPTNPYLKNTALVEPTLQKLDAEGVIEYRRLPSMPSTEMPSHVRDADVVLDQFGAGCYSVASVEGMAAGRVTVAHVHDQVRDVVRQSLGLEIPMVSANPGNLEVLLREMVADRDRYRAIAARGPSYTAAAHDGEQTARALSRFLGRG